MRWVFVFALLLGACTDGTAPPNLGDDASVVDQDAGLEDLTPPGDLIGQQTG